MYHVSTQGVDERKINVSYYYYHYNADWQERVLGASVMIL